MTPREARNAMSAEALAPLNDARLAELRPSASALAAALALLAAEPHAFIYGDEEGGLTLEWDPGTVIDISAGGVYTDVYGDDGPNGSGVSIDLAAAAASARDRRERS